MRHILSVTAALACGIMVSAAPAQTLEWTDDPPTLRPLMPAGIQMAGTAVVETDSGPFVYIVGGNKSTDAGGETTVIHYAPLEDGRPGTWREATARLVGGGTSYHTRSTVTFGPRFYVIGGRLNQEGDYSTPYNGIRVYEPDETGDIAPGDVTYYTGEAGGIVPAANPPLDLLEMAAVVTESRAHPGDGIVYILGGGFAETETAAVRKLRIDGRTGRIVDAGPGRELAFALKHLDPLPEPTAFHQAVLHEGRIYVAGNYPPSTTVWYAEILEDDTLGAWQAASAPLPEARLDCAAASFGGDLYVLGGTAGTNADTRNTVFRAIFGEDGDIEAWEADAPVPLEPGVRRVGATVTEQTLLIIGGRLSDDGFSPAVQIATRTD